MNPAALPQAVPAGPAPRPAAPAPQQGASPAALARGPVPREPVVRGQKEEEREPAPAAPPEPTIEPPPAPLSIPSPDALGLVAAPQRPPPGAPSGTDWASLRQRLTELGVVAFQVHELPQGGWRFVCDLRTARPGCLRRIETGPAATEAEAIALALAEAGRPASR
jgi:hypothetical protein